MKKTKIRTSANYLYDLYTTREKLINYKNGFCLTQGINDIIDDENCSFILDIICRQKQNFQIEIWEFSRYNGNIFTLSGKSIQRLNFVEISNLESDFYFDDLIILKKGKLICLPIEENIYR